MKKQIRLLIENLFDDIYNNDTDLDSEIADEYITNYKVGDLIYKNKEPYAICCGDKSDFQDNTQRFLLLVKPQLKIYAKVPTYLEYLGKQDITDENGYKNTQIIKEQYYLKSFPAFNFCTIFDDDAYLPAIHELKILSNNYDLINKKLNRTEFCLLPLGTVSSSQNDSDNYYSVLLFSNNIFLKDKSESNLVYPFIKI